MHKIKISYISYVDEVMYDWIETEKEHKNDGNLIFTTTLPDLKLEHIVHDHHDDLECRPSNKTFTLNEDDCDFKKVLEMKFEFRRYLSAYVTSYVPAMVMVLIAGLGTFITPHAVAARASIGITTILTTLTLIQSTKRSSGNLSYMTALDIYMWTSFMFVSSGILHFIYINYTMNLDDTKVRRSKSNKTHYSNRIITKHSPKVTVFPSTRDPELFQKQASAKLFAEFSHMEESGVSNNWIDSSFHDLELRTPVAKTENHFSKLGLKLKIWQTY